MSTPEPRITCSVDASAWSPPLPEASGFDHLVVETPGLHTHVAAIGEGESVVLLHGFPQHWWQWRAIAPVIAASGYRVICPDLRGAGWTVADDPRVERETRLRDLLALLDVLHIERAHLASHDMGVITAMQLTYDHPERVRTAVQLAVPPGFMTFSPKFLPGFRHLPPFVWQPPGRLTARSLLSGLRRPPDVGGSRRSPPRPDAPTRHRRRGASALPPHGPARRHAHDARRLPPPAARGADPWCSAAATAPGRRSSWAVSAAILSSTPIASSSPTSTTQRISSPTTPPPRSPTSRSTGSNEQLDVGHYSGFRSPHRSTLSHWAE
jgi:pimeloyl-ACP methyl ester carboxylesterase